MSEKLDDSIRSPSIKSESVSIHEGDEEPQSLSEDQYDQSQPVAPIAMAYPKVEAPKSVKCNSKRNVIKPAFRFEREDLDQQPPGSLEYDLDAEPNVNRADIISQNEESENLYVPQGSRKQLVASPNLLISAKDAVSASQISSYQMIDVNADQEDDNANASQERLMAFVRHAPNNANQLNVRPFERHIQGGPNDNRLVGQFYNQ